MLYGLPEGLDLYTVGQTSAYYSWAVPTLGSDGGRTITEADIANFVAATGITWRSPMMGVISGAPPRACSTACAGC